MVDTLEKVNEEEIELLNDGSSGKTTEDDRDTTERLPECLLGTERSLLRGVPQQVNDSSPE